MHQDFVSSQSTLAALQPNQSFELRWRDFRNAPRYQGSHLLMLRRPTRHPEASRKYVHGDPVHMIDWKAFARTDQLILRVQRDEASVRIRIVIDTSETMQWPTQDVLNEARRTLPTKAEVAFRIGLNIAHGHLQLGDFVDVWIAEPKDLPALRYNPRSSSDIAGQFRRMVNDGFGLPAEEYGFTKDEFPATSCDVVYWVGDGLSHAPLERVLTTGKRAAMIHLLSSLEVDASWLQNDRCYFDEYTVKKEYQGQQLVNQDNYRNSLQKWLAATQKRLQKNGALYVQVTDTTPIHQFYRLMSFFD